MIPVGGANGLVERLMTLLRYNATSDTSRQERIDALNFLNWAQRFICNREALLFLNYTWSISVITNQTKIDLSAAPFVTVGFDYSKDHVLFDGNGMPLTYYPLDEFHRATGVVDSAFGGPNGYIISVDNADSKRYILFDDPQPTNATFTLHGQRHVTDVTDSAASYMLLPEGDELVLALPIAEQFAKQRDRSIDAPILDAQTRDSLDAFYGRHRANKLTSATDTNRERRVNDKRAGQLAEE